MTVLSETLLAGDCRDLMPERGPFDMILADPPYGDTSLSWDRRVEGWLPLARAALKQTGSLWVFGSLRSFMVTAIRFADAGFRIAQEIVWEKQNGSSFHADRFKRVHELAVQFYPAETPWRDVYNDVQTTPDALARTVRRRSGRPLPARSTPATMSARTAGRASCARSSTCATRMAAPSIRPRSRPRFSKS